VSPRLTFIVDVPLDKVAVGRLAVSGGVPRETVVARLSDELEAAFRRHCERHEAVAGAVHIERSAGG
jgi:hypothetical protein